MSYNSYFIMAGILIAVFAIIQIIHNAYMLKLVDDNDTVRIRKQAVTGLVMYVILLVISLIVIGITIFNRKSTNSSHVASITEAGISAPPPSPNQSTPLVPPPPQVQQERRNWQINPGMQGGPQERRNWVINP